MCDERSRQLTLRMNRCCATDTCKYHWQPGILCRVNVYSSHVCGCFCFCRVWVFGSLNFILIFILTRQIAGYILL